MRLIVSGKKEKIYHMIILYPSNNATQPENKLIHEHDFITARIKETNSFFIHCITCGICYCGLCGKALEDKVTNNHECYNITSGCHSLHSALGVAENR
jgi:hypothetical protein